MIGQHISHYEVREKLGEGGMGVVYLAEDTRLGRQVAIKFLPRNATASEEDRLRFEQEARAAARLNHPNICTIHHFDEHEGHPFLVMEYVEGTTLRDRLRDGPLSVEEAVEYATQITEALAKAHQADITHRDIKPGNIMINAEGRVKVMDFGLARLRGANRLTRTGSTLGTLAYMAPEQIQGKNTDHRSDIFSFGVVLYEMLTGTHPFSGEYEQAIAYRLVNEDPSPPSSLQEEIPARLDEIATRCLEKDPGHRYSSADAVHARLQGEQKTVELFGSSFNRLPKLFSKPITSYRSPTTLGTVIGLMLLIAAGLLLLPQWFGDGAQGNIPDAKHVVVLPFNNLSEGAISQSLNDGIQELLTSKITQMKRHEGDLWVVPSSEVRYERVTSASEASRTFGATIAVTGSLQQVNDQYLLTINLVDATTMRQLNSNVLEIDARNIPELQDRLVHALAEMLEIDMEPDAMRTMVAGGSDDAAAFRLYTEGRGLLRDHHDFDNILQAIEKFENAIAADPEYVRAYAGLGEAYGRKYAWTRDAEFTERAIEYGERALLLDEGTAEAYIAMAFIYNEIERYDEALEMIDRLDERDRQASDALQQRARAYAGTGQPEQAERIYQEAIAQDADHWFGYHLLGVFYYHQGRYDEAVDAFTVVTELTPMNIRAYNNLGASYFALQQPQEALDALEASLDIRPNRVAYSNLGTFYFYDGDYDRAVQKFEQAAEFDEADYQIWGNLASIYYWMDGKEEELEPALSRAIELAEKEREITPRNARLLARLANFYAMQGEREHAHNVLADVTDLDDISVEIMSIIAGAYELLDEREEALRWIETAVDQGYPREMLETNPGMADLLEDPRMRVLQEEQEAGT